MILLSLSCVTNQRGIILEYHVAFALRRKGEAGLHILLRQVWEVVKNFRHGHPGREIRKDIVDGDSHPANTWTATAFSWLDRDSGSPLFVHERSPLAERRLTYRSATDCIVTDRLSTCHHSHGRRSPVRWPPHDR